MRWSVLFMVLLLGEVASAQVCCCFTLSKRRGTVSGGEEVCLPDIFVDDCLGVGGRCDDGSTTAPPTGVPTGAPTVPDDACCCIPFSGGACIQGVSRSICLKATGTCAGEETPAPTSAAPTSAAPTSAAPTAAQDLCCCVPFGGGPCTPDIPRSVCFKGDGVCSDDVTSAPTSAAPTSATPTSAAPTSAPTSAAPTNAPTTCCCRSFSATTGCTEGIPVMLCEKGMGQCITEAPTQAPTLAPTAEPTTLAPTPEPTTLAPTAQPTTLAPTPEPTTLAPTPQPTTLAPTPEPTTLAPTPEPTTLAPTSEPTTLAPTPQPTTLAPTPQPTTLAPTPQPTTLAPTLAPTPQPTTLAPTAQPTIDPNARCCCRLNPSDPCLADVLVTVCLVSAGECVGTGAPTPQPTLLPTSAPTSQPTQLPTSAPTVGGKCCCRSMFQMGDGCTAGISVDLCTKGGGMCIEPPTVAPTGAPTPVPPTPVPPTPQPPTTDPSAVCCCQLAPGDPCLLVLVTVCDVSAGTCVDTEPPTPVPPTPVPPTAAPSDAPTAAPPPSCCCLLFPTLPTDNCLPSTPTDRCVDVSGGYCEDTCTGVSGGAISTTSPTTISVGDNVADVIDVTVSGWRGRSRQLIITDEAGMVLALPTTDSPNLDGAGEGVCLVWNLGYTGTLLIGVGQNVNSAPIASGCSVLSNSIRVERTRPATCCCLLFPTLSTDNCLPSTPTDRCVDVSGGYCEDTCTGISGGVISTASATTIVVGDGISDVINVDISGARGRSMRLVVTDAAGVVLATPTGNSVDLEGAGAGVCLVWNLAYTGASNIPLGANANTAMLSDGCFALSNPITVTRNDASSTGGTTSTTTTTTTTTTGTTSTTTTATPTTSSTSTTAAPTTTTTTTTATTTTTTPITDSPTVVPGSELSIRVINSAASTLPNLPPMCLTGGWTPPAPIPGFDTPEQPSGPLQVCRVYAVFPDNHLFVAASFEPGEEATLASGPLYGNSDAPPSALEAQVFPWTLCGTYATTGDPADPVEAQRPTSSCPQFAPNATSSYADGRFGAAWFCTPGTPNGTPPANREIMVFQAAMEPALATGPLTGIITLFANNGQPTAVKRTFPVTCF